MRLQAIRAWSLCTNWGARFDANTVENLEAPLLALWRYAKIPCKVVVGRADRTRFVVIGVCFNLLGVESIRNFELSVCLSLKLVYQGFNPHRPSKGGEPLVLIEFMPSRPHQVSAYLS